MFLPCSVVEKEVTGATCTPAMGLYVAPWEVENTENHPRACLLHHRYAVNIAYYLAVIQHVLEYFGENEYVLLGVYVLPY